VLAYEVAQYGITANAVCPGTTASELVTTTLLKGPVALEGWWSSGSHV